MIHVQITSPVHGPVPLCGEFPKTKVTLTTDPTRNECRECASLLGSDAAYENVEEPPDEEEFQELLALRRWKIETLPLIQLLDDLHGLLPVQHQASPGSSKAYALKAYLTSLASGCKPS